MAVGKEAQTFAMKMGQEIHFQFLLLIFHESLNFKKRTVIINHDQQSLGSGVRLTGSYSKPIGFRKTFLKILKLQSKAVIVSFCSCLQPKVFLWICRDNVTSTTISLLSVNRTTKSNIRNEGISKQRYILSTYTYKLAFRGPI